CSIQSATWLAIIGENHIGFGGSFGRELLVDCFDCVETTGHFHQGHMYHALDLSIVVQRTVAMAALIEQQSWLVNELQHSLGQPLQHLHRCMDKMLLCLRDHHVDDDNIISFRSDRTRSFQIVHEAKDQLGIFAKMSQLTGDWSFSKINLSRLIADCCKFMTPEAKQKGCRITWSEPQIEPIWGQKQLLRKEILNVLENALKYT
ncbi:MAG: hypothetical protein ABIK28_08965, partial [Planctomycetota bacterium]